MTMLPIKIDELSLFKYQKNVGPQNLKRKALTNAGLSAAFAPGGVTVNWADEKSHLLGFDVTLAIVNPYKEAVAIEDIRASLKGKKYLAISFTPGEPYIYNSSKRQAKRRKDVKTEVLSYPILIMPETEQLISVYLPTQLYERKWRFFKAPLPSRKRPYPGHNIPDYISSDFSIYNGPIVIKTNKGQLKLSD